MKNGLEKATPARRLTTGWTRIGLLQRHCVRNSTLEASCRGWGPLTLSGFASTSMSAISAYLS